MTAAIRSLSFLIVMAAGTMACTDVASEIVQTTVTNDLGKTVTLHQCTGLACLPDNYNGSFMMKPGQSVPARGALNTANPWIVSDSNGVDIGCIPLAFGPTMPSPEPVTVGLSSMVPAAKCRPWRGVGS